MPGAATLPLGDRDVCPAGLAALDDADELAQVGARLVEVGNVAAVGEGEQVVLTCPVKSAAWLGSRINCQRQRSQNVQRELRTAKRSADVGQRASTRNLHPNGSSHWRAALKADPATVPRNN